MTYTHIAEMILHSIERAEELYKNERNKGREKKAFVMNVSHEVISNLLKASPVGEDAKWQTIEPAISTFVDASVSLCNVFTNHGADEDFEWRKLVGTI